MQKGRILMKCLNCLKSTLMFIVFMTAIAFSNDRDPTLRDLTLFTPDQSRRGLVRQIEDYFDAITKGVDAEFDRRKIPQERQQMIKKYIEAIRLELRDSVPDLDTPFSYA